MALEPRTVSATEEDSPELQRGVRLQPHRGSGAATVPIVIARHLRWHGFFAFVYNAAGVPIAAGVLYPALGLLLSPIIAAAAMSFSSVSVIGNALRLRRAQV
jgi:hypothetical protein